MRRLIHRSVLAGLSGLALCLISWTILDWPSWAGLTPRQLGHSHELWADVPLAEPEEFWGWLAEENKRIRGEETRRVSWGALKSQGAKATVRENLRDDRRYLLPAFSGGFTNEFMSMCNAIYLAHESHRIPILMPFVGHKSQLGGPAVHDPAVSDVFDLRLASVYLGGMPIVELHELVAQDYQQHRHRVARFDGEFEQEDALGRTLVPGDLIVAEPPGTETLGCWSYSITHGRGPLFGRFSDIQWVPIPKVVYANGDDATEHGADLVKVSGFMRDAHEIPEESLQTLDELHRDRPAVLPDPRLFCIDEVFWYIDQPQRRHRHAEWYSGSGAWAAVGKYVRFQPALVRLADEYLLHAFGMGSDQPLPPFFAVHIRRGDFPPEYLAATTTEHYAHAVWVALREIKELLNINTERIIFTTDERDPEWRAPLLSYGWHFVDHNATGTSERFGHWMPTLLDTVILSRATGFLGTADSTLSIINMRRVIDWNGGVGRLMDWGHRIPEGWKWPGIHSEPAIVLQ